MGHRFISLATNLCSPKLSEPFGVDRLYSLNEKPEKYGTRTRVEIIASMLDVAARGALKTHIMYRANLSHGQLEKYLQFLEEKGLIRKLLDDSGGYSYEATEKGIEFLKDYARLSQYFQT